MTGCIKTIIESLVGGIAGGLIGFMSSSLLFFLQGKREKKKKRLEKFEEITFLLIKTQAYIIEHRKFYRSFLREDEVNEFSTEIASQPLLLINLLQLYCKDFSEELAKFLEAYNKLSNDTVKLVASKRNLKDKNQLEKIVSKLGEELQSVCNEIQDKINNIFEKEYKRSNFLSS
jgi:hypothetical protein